MKSKSVKNRFILYDSKRFLSLCLNKKIKIFFKAILYSYAVLHYPSSIIAMIMIKTREKRNEEYKRFVIKMK